MSSYNVDNVALKSSRFCHSATLSSSCSQMIDANSNSALVGVSGYQTQKCSAMSDLNDQLRMLRKDVDRKDKLIKELSAYRTETLKTTSCNKSCSNDCSSSCSCDQTHHVIRTCTRVCACSCKCNGASSSRIDSSRQSQNELNITLIKLEKITNELNAKTIEVNECRTKLSSSDKLISELIKNIDALKQENSVNNSTHLSKISELEKKISDLQGFEPIIKDLKTEKASYQQQIIDLESKIALHLTEKSSINSLIESLKIEHEKQIKDLEAKINLHIIEKSEIQSKMESIKAEFNSLKISISVLTNTTIIENEPFSIDSIKTMISNISDGFKKTIAEKEVEIETNREAIERLKYEYKSMETSLQKANADINNFQIERETLLSKQKSLITELEKLDKSLLSMKTQSELDKTASSSFLKEVSTLLSDNFVKVDANEYEIKEKICLLMNSSINREKLNKDLEIKIKELTKKLTEEINSKESFKLSYESSYQKITELETCIKRLEEIKVCHCNIENERKKLNSRIEQLEFENGTLQIKIKNLNCQEHKIVSLNEQLSNKDVHLDILRRKIAQLEECKAGRSEIKKEIDEQSHLNKKLSIKAERLSAELSSLKNQNIELKAKILDIEHLTDTNKKQVKEIISLKAKITELEKEINKNLIQIGGLRDENDIKESEIIKTRSTSDSVIQKLTLELKNLKNDCCSLLKREREYLNFRESIALKLGLDISMVSRQDFEMLARIQSFITSIQNSHIHLHTVCTKSFPCTQLACCYCA